MSERICMFCKHLSYDDGGWGDYADPAELSCNKGHFDDSGRRFVSDVDDFRKIIVRAKNCADYDEARRGTVA